MGLFHVSCFIFKSGGEGRYRRHRIRSNGLTVDPRAAGASEGAKIGKYMCVCVCVHIHDSLTRMIPEAFYPLTTVPTLLSCKTNSRCRLESLKFFLIPSGFDLPVRAILNPPTSAVLCRPCLAVLGLLYGPSTRKLACQSH